MSTEMETDTTQNGSSESISTEVMKEGLLKPPLVDRLISCESGVSNYSDAMSTLSDDDDDIDMYYVEDDGMSEEPESTMNTQLYADMENTLLIYGDNSLSFRLLKSIDEIDIELNIPLVFLEPETAEAWNVNRKEPLIVRLHFSLSSYVDSAVPPKVEVFQPSKKEKFGLGTQIKKILENFLHENWHGLSDRMQAAAKQSQAKKSKSFPNDLSGQSVKGIKRTLFAVDDESLSTLMSLGFSAELARNALIITRGSVEEASNLLLSNPESCTDLTLDIEQDIGEESVKSHKPPPPKRQQSHPPLLKSLKKMLPSFSRATSMVPSATDPNISSSAPLEDLNLVPLSTLDGKNAKKVPSVEDGFLIQVFRYVRQRIPTLNEYCVVCDDQHIFQNGAMLKPAVCSRELCVFAFQTLGVMSDAADDIATGAEVVDLLLAMTRAACKSNRKATIFDPYPTVVDPTCPTELAFHPKNKNFNEIEKVIDCFLPMEDMSKIPSATLKKRLDEDNMFVYPLMQWIIASNRSHIVKLPTERQLEFMHTPHQFLLLSSPPAKEAEFRVAKEKHGSTFAFHGSSIENWHSIIRQGLLNASGTKLQVNGAAYGKGIYLSPFISTSMGYSRMGYGSQNVKKNQAHKGETRFLKSINLTCIAICEIILSPTLKKSSGIWVHPEPDHVCTRFFFVYEDGQVGDSSIDTQQEKYLAEIRKVCGYKV